MSAQGNYISAELDYELDAVKVWERHGNDRVLVRHPSPYYFYVEDDEGEFKSLWNKPLKKLTFDSNDEFEEAKRHYKKRYESDIKPLDKVLMNEYYGRELPAIHFTALDIEVATNMDVGWSRPENPYAPINAITMYHSWLDKFVTIAVPPEEWDGTWEYNKHPNFKFDDVIIVSSERELLMLVLQEIENADIITGWNSEFFDAPYLVKRTEMVLGKAFTQRWCFPQARGPKFNMVTTSFGDERMVVKLNGRAHLDYMDLFKKFTFEGRPSYALAYIAEVELDIPKLEYDGTLEELYHNDFSTFVAYNYRDTEIIKELDKKYKLMALAMQLSHENTVPLEAILGTVKYVETGIANYAHHYFNAIAQDKTQSEDLGKVEGAIVLTPKIGLHDWVGSVDINSLYPSVIRSLNISPEKFVGQFAGFESSWRDIKDKTNTMHTLKFDDGETATATGAEWWQVLQKKQWVVSAYGTVFDESNGKGVVADILGFWYAERKRLQAEKKKWTAKITELEKIHGEDSNNEELVEARKQEDYYDLLQLTKKIQLNSAYGALLNRFFRWGRQEFGASVTATGRQITTHMLGTIGQLLTGEFAVLIKTTNHLDDGTVQHLYHTDNPAVIYSDTDSGYFRTFAENIDEAVLIADSVAKQVNDSFPEFMEKSFNCKGEFSTLIKAGREVVAERGIFQAKKKYMLRVVDMEGKRVNKIKSQGSEIKKSDTPKMIQNFLKDIIDMILDGKPYQELVKRVNESRGTLITKKNLISLGVSKACNNLEAGYNEWKAFEKAGLRKVKLTGHVRAAINHNEIATLKQGKSAEHIRSGDKVMVFELKPNNYGFKSIAFSSDISKFPDWFDEFEVDLVQAEQKLIDAKLKGVFAAIGKDVPTIQGEHFDSLFEF